MKNTVGLIVQEKNDENIKTFKCFKGVARFHRRLNHPEQNA
jgi:hypothetical protein